MRHDFPAAPLSRRDFIRVSGAAAALSILDPMRSAAPTRPLACRLASYGTFERAAWSHLRTLGIRHLFLNVPEPDRVEQTLAQLAAHSLKPLVMRGAVDLSEASSVDALAVQLATCKKMDVRYMFLSPKHGTAPKEVAYERLRKAGDAAKENDAIISLETHPDLGTNGAVHPETMKAIDHPNVRVNFDTGNITYYNRECEAADELKKIIDYVATVEVKDHNGEFETWVFPPLGKGIVDFKSVLGVLDASGYTGPVTLEFEGTKGVELDESQTKKAIEESIAYIRALATFV